MARGKAPTRRPAPSAPAAKKAGGKGRAAPVEVESEASEDENFVSFDKQEDNSDVEDEAGVFDLKMKDSDDEDDSEEEDEESEEDSDDDDRFYEDDEDLNEEERDLQALVDNLPLEMRTKIRSGQPIDESEEEQEEEDPDEAANWGKKKAYYSGDTADLEIGQDMEDALDEEEAAKELYQQKTKRMKKKDFYDDLDAADDSNDDDEAALSSHKKKKQTKDRVAKELEAIALGSSGDVGADNGEVVLEKLAKDVSKMSKAQKLELIAENSPELLTIVSELRERVDELQSRITPVKELVNKLLSESEMKVDDDLVDYLEVKQQLLLSYCVNVTFYLYMKSLGKSVRNHPVMRQLLRLRYCMEKMQALDGKLKYQIDRLAKVAEAGQVSGELQASLLRPNLASLLEDEEEEEEAAGKKKKSARKSKKHHDSSEEEEESEESEVEDDEEDRRAAKASSKDNIYRAPKLTSMPYPNERDEEKREAKLEKHKQKLRTSELMAALTAEFGTTPEEAASSGFGDNNGDLKRLEEEQKERIKFEEDHFVRTTMSRKEKKDIKRRTRDASRIDNFEDIGDFGDMEEITKLTSSAAESGKSKKKGLGDASNPFMDASSSKALKRAAMEFGAKSSGKTPFDLIAAEFGESGEGHTGHKRRRAPESMDNMDLGEDDGENIFDDFVNKKKTFLDKKKEHYTAEPRYGGFEETVDEGRKRAASNEIIKNRGLTPHRKKENRNGRVKKRAAFEKATIKRKGQVRDVITGAAASYGGEGTGIKSQVSRSRKM